MGSPDSASQPALARLVEYEEDVVRLRGQVVCRVALWLWSQRVASATKDDPTAQRGGITSGRSAGYVCPDTGDTRWHADRYGPWVLALSGVAAGVPAHYSVVLGFEFPLRVWR